MRAAIHRRNRIAGLALCLPAYVAAAAAGGMQAGNLTEAQPAPYWTVQYTVSGGIAGRVEHISVRKDGSTETWGAGAGKGESMLSSEQLAKIRSLVLACPLADTTKPAESQIPDMISSELTIERNGHVYYIGPEGKELAQALDRIFMQKAKETEDAKWAKAGPFRLGRIWKVTEEIRDAKGQFHGDYWLGTWTRRDKTSLFDGVWRDSRTGEEVKDVMQFDFAERGSLSFHRLGTHQTYRGSYRAEQMNTIDSGTIGSLGSAPCSWWGTVEE